MSSSLRWAFLSLGLLLTPADADALDLESWLGERIKPVGEGLDRVIERVTGTDAEEEPASTSDESVGEPAVAVPTAPDRPKAPSREEIAEIQERLNDLGYDAGPVDGLMGLKTRGAIVAFQRDAGISPDGAASPSVLRALRARPQGMQTAQPQPRAQPRAPEQQTARAAPRPASPTAEPAYPDFVRLALSPIRPLSQRSARAPALRTGSRSWTRPPAGSSPVALRR